MHHFVNFLPFFLPIFAYLLVCDRSDENAHTDYSGLCVCIVVCSLPVFIHHRALYLYEYATGIVLKSRSRASNVYAVFMLCRHDSVLRRVALRVHGNAIVVRVACVSAKYKCVQ